MISEAAFLCAPGFLGWSALWRGFWLVFIVFIVGSCDCGWFETGVAVVQGLLDLIVIIVRVVVDEAVRLRVVVRVVIVLGVVFDVVGVSFVLIDVRGGFVGFVFNDVVDRTARSWVIQIVFVIVFFGVIIVGVVMGDAIWQFRVRSFVNVRIFFVFVLTAAANVADLIEMSSRGFAFRSFRFAAVAPASSSSLDDQLSSPSTMMTFASSIGLICSRC